MANIFNSIQLVKPSRNRFNKSFNEKYTTNLGILYPIFFEEVVPSSHVELKESHFVRFQPMLAPIFDNVTYKQYYFFVPYRILMNHDTWEEFRTGGVDQDFKSFTFYTGDERYNFPFMSEDSYDLNLIQGLKEKNFYSAFELPFGVPQYGSQTGNITGFKFDIPELPALPLAAYLRIYVDYFADEQIDSNLIDIVRENSYSDILTYYRAQTGNLSLFRKYYKKDYFTSATSSPQLGQGINLPIASSINLGLREGVSSTLNLNLTGFTNTSSNTNNVATNNDVIARRPANANVNTPYDLYLNIGGQLSSAVGNVPLNINTLLSRIQVQNNDIFSINDLRNSFLLQELLERNNVAGYRYFEWVKAHFGITSPDARLQRAEFLGSTSDIINFVEVEQNSVPDSDNDTPLGYLAGKGVGGGANNIFSRTFNEDGIIIGLACYVPQNTYYQGLPRMYNRKNGLDYLTPLFERLGEQPIYNSELFYTGTSSDNEVFGFNSRYSDYKSRNNIEKGDFVHNLKYWTLSRELYKPVLNKQFLTINYEDFNDVFAVQDDSDKILCTQSFDLVHTLPLHRYSVPAKI